MFNSPCDIVGIDDIFQRFLHSPDRIDQSQHWQAHGNEPQVVFYRPMEKIIRWLRAIPVALRGAKWWYGGKAMAIYAIVGLAIAAIALYFSHIGDATENERSVDSSQLGSTTSPNENASKIPTKLPQDEADSPKVERFFASYSFNRPPFIHPKILDDLTGHLSDTGDQVVAINLLDSQKSNRYFGKITIRDEEGSLSSLSPWIYAFDEKDHGNYGNLRTPFYAYQYIGTSTLGTDVLHTKFSGGGVGVFHQIIFVTTKLDHGVKYDSWQRDRGDQVTPHTVRRRELVWLIGRAGLGDRWEGTVELVGNDVVVRGRNIDQRCEEGGISRGDADLMSLSSPPDCKMAPPDHPPEARVFKVPTS